MKRVLRETPERLANVILDLDERLQPYRTFNQRHAAIDQYAKDLVDGDFLLKILRNLKD